MIGANTIIDNGIGTITKYRGNRQEYMLGYDLSQQSLAQQVRYIGGYGLAQQAQQSSPDYYTTGQYGTPSIAGSVQKTKIEEKNMVTEVAQDLKKFIRDHKSTIYIIALLLIVDHFMFHGAMKERLKALMDNLVGKVETKLNETKG